MWPIIKKEVKSYFLSPVAYVFIGLFLAMREYIFLLRCVHVFKYKFWIYVLFSNIILQWYYEILSTHLHFDKPFYFL